MWSSARLGAVLVTALWLIGCTDRVVLRDGTDGLALTYRCDAIAPQALSTAERVVVRAYAAELLRSGSGADPDRVSAIAVAYERGGWNRLEQLLVEELCDNPRVAQRLSPSLARSRYAALRVGDPAPPFTLPLLARGGPEARPEELSLSDFLSSYVILTFWATWCQPCTVEYPELATLERRLGTRGLTVLGVLHRDSPSDALAFAERQESGSYRTVVDEDGSVADAYRVRGIPVTVVVGPTGTVVDCMIGWYSGKGDELHDRFEGLLPPAPDGASSADGP
jgi:peroxiredoxin